MVSTAFKEIPGWALSILKKKMNQHGAQGPFLSRARISHDNLWRLIDNQGGRAHVVDRVVSAIESELSPKEITVWKVAEVVEQHKDIFIDTVPGANKAALQRQANVWIMRREAHANREVIAKVLDYKSTGAVNDADDKANQARDNYPQFRRALDELVKKLGRG